MRTKKMVYGGLLTAVGLVLPQAFHVFGQGAGMAFLPMHLPVMIAGILLGPCYGGLIGLIVPLVSSMLTGMPPVPKLYFMLVELVAYGIFTGIFIRKIKPKSDYPLKTLYPRAFQTGQNHLIYYDFTTVE